MKFLIKPCEHFQISELVYDRSEYAFDLYPFPGTGSTTILVNTVELAIDENGAICSLWDIVL